MDQIEEYKKLSIQDIQGLNERKNLNNPELGQLDILRNAIPTIQGSLRRMNGIKSLFQFPGEKIYSICQTNDSRQNIIVQTDQNLYYCTPQEIFSQAAYVPSLNYSTIEEEETMSQAILTHDVAANVNGGSSNTGYIQAPLTTIVSQINPDGSAAAFVTLAANQFTLAAGKYRIEGWSKASGGTGLKHRALLYNITAGANAWIGAPNEFSDEGSIGVTDINIKLFFYGNLDLAAPTIFEIRQASSSVKTNTGMGNPQNYASGREVYRWVKILKTA